MFETNHNMNFWVAHLVRRLILYFFIEVGSNHTLFEVFFQKLWESEQASFEQFFVIMNILLSISNFYSLQEAGWFWTERIGFAGRKSHHFFPFVTTIHGFYDQWFVFPYTLIFLNFDQYTCSKECGRCSRRDQDSRRRYWPLGVGKHQAKTRGLYFFFFSYFTFTHTVADDWESICSLCSKMAV